jgi:uncharacterized protein (DUF433 family)
MGCGLRIPVATVVGMIADGMTEEEILRAYPNLESENLREAEEAGLSFSSLSLVN